MFLDDPTDVPAEVVDYLAEQLGIADASALKAYGERENTRLTHVRELRKLLEYTEFGEAEAELRVWVDARAWTSGEGPQALFDAAVGWLRERRVLLPGVTALARLVADLGVCAGQAPERGTGAVTPAGAVTASRIRSAAQCARYAFCRQAGRRPGGDRGPGRTGPASRRCSGSRLPG